MDAAQFDRFARSVITSTGRRGVVQILLGVTAFGIASDAEATQRGRSDTRRAAVGAEKRGRKKKKKKKTPCVPTCAGKVCGANGCRGSCGSCTGTTVCFAGQCVPACAVCASGCFFTSVQAAINAAPAGATVTLCPGSYEEQIAIDKNLTLVGLGADPSQTVLRNTSGYIVTVSTGRTVTLRNLSVTGITGGDSGAVQNAGDLTLTAVRVTDNHPDDDESPALGAGISNGGTLTLIDGLVSDNKTSGTGGGIFNLRGEVTLIRTRIAGNQAFVGGGIDNQEGQVTLADHSRVTGNTATRSAPAGGGIANETGGTVTVSADSSITGNTPDDCVDFGSGTGCP